MLPGITGSLIAAAFLERVLAEELDQPEAPRSTLVRLHKWWRRVDRTLGPASSVRAIADTGAIPFFELLGYRLLHLEPQPDGFVGSIAREGGGSLALTVSAWGIDPGVAWRDTVRAARPVGARWGFIYTGCALRVVDAARTWSRRALDIDLPRAMADERSALAVIALLHAAGEADSSALEQLVQRSDSHGAEVCDALGQGVLEALTALLSALDAKPRRSLDPSRERSFEQALTIIYRLLFLLFAEARALVPTWHHVYRESYTIDALCRRMTERPVPVGLWKGLQAISRLAHAGCRAGDLVVTPFNGRLFSPLHTPLAERGGVPDAVIGQAIRALATGPSRHGRERIAYGDLDVEQLGAVYERVLEYEPSRQNGVLRLTKTSLNRKASGSFYTPRAMTDFLVRRALHPLVTGKSADEILRLRVLDPAMGSGAFLVAACRYLSAAVERAAVAEGSRPDRWTPGERAAVRRTVAQRCLFGVDLNPMAVQLARLSLWLSTLSNDRPLTFLDHHLVTGDSLVGAGFMNLAAPPRIGRTRRTRENAGALPLFDAATAEHLAHRVLPERLRLAMEPGRTPAEIRAKEQSLAELSAPGSPLQQWKQAADFWCATWFWSAEPVSRGVHSDVLGSLTGLAATLPNHQRAALLARAAATAQQHQFFHWELEFPEVFFDGEGRPLPGGGFDVVLGNPPWDVLRADTGDRAARQHARGEHSRRLRFFRDSGIYTHQSRGHANRYQLFLERALQLTRPGGRVALILPAGLASDQGSASLRRHLLNSVAVDRLLGFDNREAIFPIHRDVRFLLLTGTKGRATDRLICAFGHSDAAALDDLPDAASEESPDARRIAVSRSLLEHWDPGDLSIPLITNRTDLDILSLVAASVPKLGHRDGWNVTFGRELNATDDRPHFVSRASSVDPALLTVVEGKHVEPFRVLADASTIAVPAALAATLVDAGRTFRRARLAYRDVASATNRVTLIAAVLPPGTISTHTLFCAKAPLGEAAQYCLLALLNSLVANHLVRLQVTTHVTTALMARLPVPKPAHSSRDFRDLAALARVLEKTGVAANDAVYARLNAIAARLYGLTRTQYAHVLGTFPLLPLALREKCLRSHEQATAT
jgi:hypothetical protein